MRGHQMQRLFVKGEVELTFPLEENLTACSVNITNDGWHVTKHLFRVTSKEDLEKQFAAYLNTESFQREMDEQRVRYYNLINSSGN